MSSMRDGLGNEEISLSGLALANNAYFVGSITTENQISGANIYATTKVSSPILTGANVSGTTAVRGAAVIGTTVASALGQLGPVGTGSPTTFGLSMLTGAATASNAAVTVTFGTAFRAAPQVIVTPLGSVTTAGVASGTTATAFGLLGVSGTSHSWLAIGSL